MKVTIILLIAVGMLLLASLFVLPIAIRRASDKMTEDYRRSMAQDSTNQVTSKELISQITKIEKRINASIPKTHYLIINSSANEFALMRGKELIKKDKCSTGSYLLLKNDDNQQWKFSTPKGEFRIRHKTTNPVWKKPDWAFVEAGLPIPTANHSSRFEYGVLGDYSLGIGDGYLIHGTLYQRFIGLPVTHGCVRLNDVNLELVYKSLDLGSKVYIF